MRIRQIRPEFFTDPVTGRLSPAVQVTYIGLWCVADDAGYLDWDVQQLGALLYPYKSIHVRTAMIEQAARTLMESGRLVIHDCGCAVIPKLVDHQKVGGNKAEPGLNKHRVHTSMDKSELSASNVTVSNGRVGNGTREGDASGAPSLKERVAAHGYKPS